MVDILGSFQGCRFIVSTYTVYSSLCSQQCKQVSTYLTYSYIFTMARGTVGPSAFCFGEHRET